MATKIKLNKKDISELYSLVEEQIKYKINAPTEKQTHWKELRTKLIHLETE